MYLVEIECSAVESAAVFSSQDEISEEWWLVCLRDVPT